MKKSLILCAAFLAACSAAAPTEGGIEISDIRINPPLPGQTTGVGFMTLENKGTADRLLAVTSPVSGRVELHTMIDDGDIVRMRKVEGIDLPAGATVALKPGGHHLMMFDSEMTLGEDTTMTLDFENAEDLTLVVPIIKRGAKPTMSNHGSHSKPADHGSATEH